MRHALAAFFVFVFLVASGGCASGPAPLVDGPVYPEGAALLGSLDIQVEIGEQEIVLSSGEAREFGPSTIWINRWYAAPVEGIPRGARLVVPLSSFMNEYGAAPRGAGFFATRERDQIVLTEIETPEGIYGLRVVGSRD